MTNTLMGYLEEFGDCSFHERPFSSVDALLFSQLSYLRMKNVVPGFGRGKGITLKEMMQHKRADELFDEPSFGAMYREIVKKIYNRKRYRQLRFHNYYEWFNPRKECQFAAVTISLGTYSHFISFRGTDETLIGWKEDFNSSFLDHTPSQRQALDYLKGAARYTRGNLVVGGHSKGGNLSVYSCAKADKEIQNRIRRIYSFDGMGFSDVFFASPGFRRITGKIVKIIPDQSIIGVLFNCLPDYRVVDSYKSGFSQHDLMQWKIEEGQFLFLNDLPSKYKKRAVKINQWLAGLSVQRREWFINTLFRLLEPARNVTIYDLAEHPLDEIKYALHEIKGLERSSRKEFIFMLQKMLRLTL